MRVYQKLGVVCVVRGSLLQRYNKERASLSDYAAELQTALPCWMICAGHRRVCRNGDMQSFDGLTSYV